MSMGTAMMTAGAAALGEGVIGKVPRSAHVVDGAAHPALTSYLYVLPDSAHLCASVVALIIL